jgi:hypothetical protein
MLAAILIPLAFFAMVFGVVYISVTARNRERLTLIEKGADPKLFESIKKPSKGGIMKWGLLLIGIGLGFFFAALLDSSSIIEEGVAYPSMICLFGGASLLIAYKIEQKANDPKGNE